MHSGYPIMKAEVVFDGWGNVDEVSWQDIRLTQAGSEDEDSEEESESEGEAEGRREGGERRRDWSWGDRGRCGKRRRRRRRKRATVRW